MTIMYKLVSDKGLTHGGMTWGIGKTNRAVGSGNKMCTDSVLHCYADPHLAVIFNIIHANYTDPILYEIECSPIVNSDGLKYACKEQTPTKRIPVPIISPTQKVAFAIKCALSVYKNPIYAEWANAWLAGTDRTEEAAGVAQAAAQAAARAAEAAARAAWAAEAAAWAARAAWAAEAAEAAARAARSAEAVARSARAAWAAEAAAWAAQTAEVAAEAAAEAVARAARAAARDVQPQGSIRAADKCGAQWRVFIKEVMDTMS